MTLAAAIDRAWEDRANLSPRSAPAEVRDAVEAVIAGLDAGTLRVAEKSGGAWVVHQWVKKAVLLSFRLADNVAMGPPVDGAPFRFYDKVPSKFAGWGAADFAAAGARVGEGTMVDTWATVGSCAQIGAHVHLSGGVGIGGVLEPLQANPTIIEDHCFIGARSEVVEGVIVEENSVLGMGVYLGQSTRIYDRATGGVSYGRVPAGSVVVSGSLPAADGSHSLYCAVIVKKVDAKTRAKTAINELLRT
jgi:2,3,4,5-tetrahydropyridine-2-carboxylate N-succinyltransferase